MVNKSDFRVVESNNVFRVSRKYIDTITTGSMWWKKIELKETWCRIATNGVRITFLNCTAPLKDFNTLDEAYEWIDKNQSIITQKIKIKYDILE